MKLKKIYEEMKTEEKILVKRVSKQLIQIGNEQCEQLLASYIYKHRCGAVEGEGVINGTGKLLVEYGGSRVEVNDAGSNVSAKQANVNLVLDLVLGFWFLA